MCTKFIYHFDMFFFEIFRDNEIECDLFDQVASDVAMSQAQNSDTDSALVAVINLGRITWSLNSMLLTYQCTTIHQMVLYIFIRLMI